MEIGFKISTNDSFDWSIRGIAQLTLGLSTITDGVALCVDGVAVIDEISAAQPSVTGSPEWDRFVRYLHDEGSAMAQGLVYSDPLAHALARGFLVNGTRDSRVKFVRLKHGSVEGAIEAIAKEVGTAIADLLRSIFDPHKFRSEAVRVANAASTPLERHRASALMSIGRSAIHDACSNAHAKITVTTGSASGTSPLHSP